MRKIKYILAIIILLILNLYVTNAITNSRYLSSITMNGLANIGYTIFELSEYQNSTVTKYDASSQTLTIGPRESSTLQYKITNKKSNHYNQMNLQYNLRIVDLEGDNNLTFVTLTDGNEYIEGTSKEIAWDGKSEDGAIFAITISCNENVFQEKNLRYQIVAEATSENGKVVVRRTVNLNIRIFDTYIIEYELYNNGINDSMQPTAFNIGETVTLLEPTSNTHDFLGWYDNPEYTGNAITVFSGKNNNQKFYAKWQEKNTHLLTITTNLNNANIEYATEYGINGNENGELSIRFYEGDTVTVTVSADRYRTEVRQYYIDKNDIVDNIVLTEIRNVTISTVPSDATIIYKVGNEEVGRGTGYLDKEIEKGSNLIITVSKSGYTTKTLVYDNLNQDINETFYAFALNTQLDVASSSVPTVICKADGNTYTNSSSVKFFTTNNTTITASANLDGYFSLSGSEDGLEYTINSKDINETVTLKKIYYFTVYSQISENSTYKFKSYGAIDTNSFTLTSTNSKSTTSYDANNRSKTISVAQGDTVTYNLKPSFYRSKSDLSGYISNKTHQMQFENASDTITLYPNIKSASYNNIATNDNRLTAGRKSTASRGVTMNLNYIIKVDVNFNIYHTTNNCEVYFIGGPVNTQSNSWSPSNLFTDDYNFNIYTYSYSTNAFPPPSNKISTLTTYLKNNNTLVSMYLKDLDFSVVYVQE